MKRWILNKFVRNFVLILNHKRAELMASDRINFLICLCICSLRLPKNCVNNKRISSVKDQIRRKLQFGNIYRGNAQWKISIWCSPTRKYRTLFYIFSDWVNIYLRFFKLFLSLSVWKFLFIAQIISNPPWSKKSILDIVKLTFFFGIPKSMLRQSKLNLMEGERFFRRFSLLKYDAIVFPFSLCCRFYIQLLHIGYALMKFSLIFKAFDLTCSNKENTWRFY